ncbi:Hypothetical protein R9X50_00399200 [Acrodontium crateriforme]|uniref:ER membrane protein complex subunit 2 n=1 Tax=Acrodontium crateriforme TaxID=150365 RepID=A0AAQ3MA60_9PEZI|nr:Hypothetical protein R9X50_00399200 [Acrodontium crateriforme]
MAASFLQPPTGSSPQTAIHLSQGAASFLKSQRSAFTLPWPLTLFLNTDSQEKWAIYENTLLACLRTGDFDSAHVALNAMIDRFGKTNDRVVAMAGLYQEATADDKKELEEILEGYDDILKEDPTVFSIQKRRAALLKSMGRTAEAVTAVSALLELSPTDAEAWAELSDLYFSQGLLEQSIHCLEEVLVVVPNAWNMHAKLGEVTYIAANRTEAAGEQSKLLAESMRRFCRSVELCDDYLRGYYGLKLATTQLLTSLPTQKKSQQSDLPPIASVQKLNELATAKLANILRRSSSGEKGWDGYSAAELAAVRQLLDKDTQKIQR